MNTLVLLTREDLARHGEDTPIEKIDIMDTRMHLNFAAQADIILYHEGNSVKVLKNRKLNYYKQNHIYKGNLSEFVGKCLQENVGQNKTILEG